MALTTKSDVWSYIKDHTVLVSLSGDEYAGLGPCRVWTGKLTHDGYPRIRFKGVSWRANRLVAFLWHGKPAKGAVACHKCDNKACINHRHIYWGTKKSNAVDRSVRGQQNRGERSGTAKLTEGDVLDMRKLRESGWTYQELADWFGVTISTAHRNVNGVRWAHIP